MNGDVPLVAGIELGGTKCIAVLARAETIVERARWPTTDPASTLAAISNVMADWQRQHEIAAIGLSSFGPLGLDPAGVSFGRILNTPKPGWSDVDVRGHFASSFDGPIGFDTDVTGAALAEGRWGASKGCDNHVYLTIGTGVGAGIVIGGKPVHGVGHPEIGHVRVRRHAHDDFAGNCPIHGDCIEGLVSGPAISARAGERVESLAAGDPLWDQVAAELAELMIILILTLSPQRIVIGGGVAERRSMLFPRIHAITADLLNGYLAGQQAFELQRTIVPPRLGADAGPLGAVALGLAATCAS